MMLAHLFLRVMRLSPKTPIKSLPFFVVLHYRVMIEITEIKIPGAKARLPEPDIDALPEPAPRPYRNHSFRMIIVGPSGSGKSNVFVNLLIKVYKGVFTNVYIFCPTFDNDLTLQKLVQKHKNADGELVSFMDDDDVYRLDNEKDITTKVREILKESEKDIKVTPENEIPPKTLLVFDDLTTELYKAQVMKDLFTKGRKYEVSVIIMTNKYRVYDPIIRNNATQMIVFKPSNEQETSDIAEDVARGKDEKRVKSAMAQAFKRGEHPFVFIDNDTPKDNERFWYKFESIIPV